MPVGTLSFDQISTWDSEAVERFLYEKFQMRHLNSRKFLAELNRRCRRNGIDLHVLPAKGSHIGLIFEDLKGKERLRIVISGDKEISPGVQRNTLKYVEKLASKLAVAAVVRKILQALFE